MLKNRMNPTEDLERVHFYSAEDMASAFEAEKIVSRLKAVNPNAGLQDLNDVIELWHIKQYFKHKLIPRNLCEDDKRFLDTTEPELQSLIVTNMLRRNVQNLSTDFEKLSFDYKHSFWQITVETKAYEIYGKEALMNCVNSISDYGLSAVLAERALVDYLDKELGAFLRGKCDTIELLLDNYSTSVDRLTKRRYFPKSLSMAERESMIVEYISQSELKLNYLRIINSFRNDNNLTISDRTRMLSLRAEKEENERIIKRGDVISHSIGFAANFARMRPIVEFSDSGLTYNLACLKHIDAQGMILLLKNVFGFITPYGNIPHIALKSEDDLLDIFGSQVATGYRVNSTFVFKNKLALMHIATIETGLEKFGRSIESAIDSIIGYINTKYNVGLKFNAPAAGDSNLAKIRNLFAEFDSLAKQYRLYAEDGYIDFDLLRISSAMQGLSEIKSAISPRPKYISLKQDFAEACGLQYLLSSNNTSLASRSGNSHISLYMQLKQGLQPELEYRFQTEKLNRLVDAGVLSEAADKVYKVTAVGDLLDILYKNYFASLSRLPHEITAIIPQLESLGWIEYESALLHPLEVKYYNYWLNKKEYTNGLDLRNRYMHGVQPTNEDKIKSDYRMATFLFILFLIKIVDDLEDAARAGAIRHAKP